MDSVKAKTPAKTPKSAKKAVKTPGSKGAPMADTPRPILSAKKQNGTKSAGKPTPNKKGNAKTPKSEPKKKGKTPVKKVEEEEEDDEEDDDSEIEFNPELMKKLAEMASDDDEEDMDDDEEEEDDDDDDDDDDDEDEEGEELMDEEQLKMLIKSLKKKPVKNGEKETPAKKGKEPVKNGKKEKVAAEVAAPAKTEIADPATKELHEKSACERDAKTLFLKGLPVDIQEGGVKELSADIVAVRMRKRIRRDHKKTQIYAFVEFASEELAEKNFKLLSETELEGKKFFVDYMGKKSSHKPAKAPEHRDLDPKKLYITGFAEDTTELELKQLFPKATEVILLTKGPAKRPLGFAFAKFDDADVCADEMKRVNAKDFKGTKLVVLYAKLITDAQRKARKRKTPPKKSNAKKAKVAKDEEEDDEEEDDDDDDDDDEEEE